MPTPVTHTSNLHTVAVYQQPLGVECECGRRVLVDMARLGAHKGNMRLISSLRFVCSSCGSRKWTAWLFVDREEAGGWLMAAGPIVSKGGGQPTF
jgi:hypothetical protein